MVHILYAKNRQYNYVSDVSMFSLLMYHLFLDEYV
jgi:hypothetical protein